MRTRLLLTAAVCALLAGLIVPAIALGAGDDLNRVIDNLRMWLVGLLATLATLLLTIGGIRYLFAGGDPGAIERAKGAIKAALIGYALAALAPALVSILRRIVGG